MMRLVIVILLAMGAQVPMPLSDPRPTAVGAPRVSFLAAGCRLELTSGADWSRLWLNCGAGPHLLSEPSSLTWHVKIQTPAQALELVRLFSSGPDACHRHPAPRWIEITASDRGGWLSLDRRAFADLCPQPTAVARTEPHVPARWFVVTRCLLSMNDGHLYRVAERVEPNGATTTMDEAVVLRDAAATTGSCDMDLGE